MTSLDNSEINVDENYIYNNYGKFDEKLVELEIRHLENSTRDRCVHGAKTPITFLGFGISWNFEYWNVVSFDPVNQFIAFHTRLNLGNNAIIVNAGYGEIFIVCDEDHEICVLLFSRNLTRRLPSLNVPRRFHCACVVDDTLIVCGGSIIWEAIKSCEVFSRAENIWRMLPDMNDTRSSFAAVSVSDRRIVVIGGFNGQASLSTVEVARLPEDISSSPITGEHFWKRLPSMREARCGHSAALFEGNIFVMGGSKYLDRIEMFPIDTSEGQWVSLHTSSLHTRNLYSLIATPEFLYAFGNDGFDYCLVERRQWRIIRNSEMWTSALSSKDIFSSDRWTKMCTIELYNTIDKIVNAPSYYSHICM